MEVRLGYKQTEVGVIPVDWLVKPLGELTTLMTNGFVGVATRHYTQNDSGVLYIQGYNVEENAFNFHGIKYVTEAFHRQHMKSCLREGDLLTVQTGDVGLTTFVPANLVGSNCHALIISRFDRKRVESKFVSLYLNSVPGRARLKLIETGTTMKHLNVGDMLHFDIPLPPTMAEQQAIATALSDADALIESLEQLLAKKRQIKQGAMQELLAAKRRLPGFEGERSVKRVGEFTDCTAGGTPSTRVPEYWGGTIRWMSSGELNLKTVDEVGGRITELGLKNSSTKMIPPRCVLIGLAGQGKTRGTVAMNTVALCTNQSIAAIFPNELFDPMYLYYSLDSRYDELRELSAGDGGRGGLNLTIIRSLEIPFPELPEQTAIATILSDMDADIATLEAKLAKARAIKHGMMQELLTGRVRLVSNSTSSTGNA